MALTWLPRLSESKKSQKVFKVRMPDSSFPKAEILFEFLTAVEFLTAERAEAARLSGQTGSLQGVRCYIRHRWEELKQPGGGLVGSMVGRGMVRRAMLVLAMLSICHADFYKLLGVSKDANDRQLKKAYHKLALKHHPVRVPFHPPFPWMARSCPPSLPPSLSTLCVSPTHSHQHEDKLDKATTPQARRCRTPCGVHPRPRDTPAPSCRYPILPPPHGFFPAEVSHVWNTPEPRIPSGNALIWSDSAPHAHHSSRLTQYAGQDKSPACKKDQESAGCKKANRNFMKLSKAYETLSDPEKRRFYDQTGFADKEAQQEVSAFSPSALPCAFASVVMLKEQTGTRSLFC